MNFSSPEIQQDLQSIQGKFDTGITQESISNISSLPELSQFSELAQGLLASKLLETDENGKLNLLSLTLYQQALSAGLTDIKDYLEGEVLGVFNALKGEVEAVYNQAKEVYTELSDLGKTLQKDQSIIVDAALSTLNGATGLNINAQNLAALKQVGQGTIQNFSNLSPKQIKDLADPAFYGKVVTTTLGAALSATGVAATVFAGQSIVNSQLSNSSYMNLFSSGSTEETKTIAVFRQVYWGKGEGATPEAAAGNASSGSKLVNDYSLAVDNSNILIGSKIKFSDDSKEREAVDIATRAKGISITGPYPVVAIFFEEKEKAMEYQKKYPKYVTATIKKS